MKCILCESFQQIHVILPNPISKMTTSSINCCDAAKLHCAVLIYFLPKHSCIDKLKTISAPCAGDSWRSVCSSLPATSYADPMVKLGCSCYRMDLLPLSSTCSLTVLTMHAGSAPGKWVWFARCCSCHRCQLYRQRLSAQPMAVAASTGAQLSSKRRQQQLLLLQ